MGQLLAVATWCAFFGWAMASALVGTLIGF